MNTRPTYGSLAPRSSGPFSEYDHRRNVYRRNAGMRHEPILPVTFNAPDQVTPQAVAAIHKAFTLSKTSHDSWRSFKREGRFDARRAPGAQRMEQDIFRRKTGRSTTKVRCAVVLDASGSMRSMTASIQPEAGSKRRVPVTAAMAAAIFGCTVAKALGGIPTVDLDVFQHSYSSTGAGKLILKWRWAKGTPLGVFNEAITGIGGGGNADGHALYAITTRMLRELKRDERGVIMVVSDGMPTDYSRDGDSQAGQALIDAVAHARKNGIEVIGVSIDGNDQSVYYGDGFITFTGDWGSLGTELARHIGKLLARR